MKVTEWTYHRILKVKRGRVRQKKRIGEVVFYVTRKIGERFSGKVARPARVKVFYQHGDDFMKNLFTIIISVDIVDLTP